MTGNAFPPPPPPPPPPPSGVSVTSSSGGPTQGPWWRRKFWKLPVWGWAIIAVVVVAAGISGANKKDDEAEPASTQNSEVQGVESTTDTTEPPVTETTEALDTTTAAPVTTSVPPTTAPETVPPTTPPPPPPTLPSFGSGILLVGSDMPSGLYVTTVPDSSFGCYWARLSGVSGDFEEIITNDNMSPSAQVVVEIKATDVAFESDGCGTWVTYLPPASPPATTFGEGVWIVGQHIAPGRYRSTGPTESDFGNCYWERTSGVSGDFEQILANDNQSGPTIVEIRPTDVGFKSSGCGTWSIA